MAWCVGNSSVVREGPAVSESWRSPSPGSDGQQRPCVARAGNEELGCCVPGLSSPERGAGSLCTSFPGPSGFQAPRAGSGKQCRNSTGLGSSHAASATSRPWGPGPLGCRCDIRVLTLTHSCLVWLLRWLGPRSQPGEPRRWNLQMGRESERKLVPAS